ncbi:uncharacterized protein L3040_007752 [Drepanopeziza brunnea f. sp. 'multigermtubi']|uniref:uncharacterized protein n=1 Tax=Drepanopeziza brunnea f. sp. 'multigermtubi' TaxID=698441 RepID=UPI0023947AA7|nr:hypothetical protein L3040_007752 [Drepanopeziza brunnea f. sp. 'multigermtubi']
MLDQTHLGYRNTGNSPCATYSHLHPGSKISRLPSVVTSASGSKVPTQHYPATMPSTATEDALDVVFSRGSAGCPWTLLPGATHVVLSPTTGYTSGTNGTDTRISIDWSIAPAAPNTSTVEINSPVNNTVVPADFTDFVESDKHPSVEAEHASRNTSVNGVAYHTIPSYGRTLAAKANATLLLSPSLNQNGAARPLRYGIAFDAEAPRTVQPVGNFTGGWAGAVSDAVWGLSASRNTTMTTHDLAVAGRHTRRSGPWSPGW